MVNPITFDQVIALGGLIVAVISLLIGFVRSGRAASAESQRVADKLDTIQKTVADTRSDVRELNRKIDDHTERIARVESSINAMERRITIIESRQDI